MGDEYQLRKDIDTISSVASAVEPLQNNLQGLRNELDDKLGEYFTIGEIDAKLGKLEMEDLGEASYLFLVELNRVLVAIINDSEVENQEFTDELNSTLVALLEA